ncbi:heavy metal translocating P-type ATPase [Saccharibacillus qingshengii]|uniref:heavy metal translocating P-type ATPase n=1 Tax=Saccharibacillus qingshengii TaxID=1763540 RepID=UPI001551B051|nr:heavy metal translocating P-type ATPase [Saccharibacillus qingshengii]
MWIYPSVKKQGYAAKGTDQPVRPVSMLRQMLRHPEVRKALGSGLLMLAAWGIAYAGMEKTAVIVYGLAYMLGGWDKARDGIRKLAAERELDVNLLMVAAALGAAAIGYWNEGALLIFIFALSGALESFASDRSGRDISKLIELRPHLAQKIENEGIREIEAKELVSGDRILVRPGEMIPADGRIVAGCSAVDQSSITGESVPVDRGPDEEVYAGSLNGEGTLRIDVTRDAADTLLAKMIRMVEQAQEDSPRSQHFVERFESVYVKAVLVAAAVLIACGPWLWSGGWPVSFYKGMVFLVVASPCAIVASIMPAVLSAMSSAARHGILFKGGGHVEKLAGTRVVAFDKTGTLTRGEPELSELLPAPGWDEREVLRFAAAIERNSSHPLALAVVRKAEEAGLILPDTVNARERPGFGIEAEIEGERWSVGRLPQGTTGMTGEQNLRFAAPASAEGGTSEEAAAPSWWEAELERLYRQGRTVSFVLREDKVAALLAMSDQLRSEAREAVEGLRSLGIEVAMLTGDRSGAAAAAASEAGIELVFADLLPGDKVERIRELRARYGPVLMVGDGVNDAPAMAAADLSMGMGIRGSGAALGTADVVLMRDEIASVSEAIRLSRRAGRIIKQNLAFAIGVILLLMAGSLSLDFALPLGVLGHEGSTLLVILNGLRLLGKRTFIH